MLEKTSYSIAFHFVTDTLSIALGVGTSIAGGLRASIRTQQSILYTKIEEYNSVQIGVEGVTTTAEELFSIVKEETDRKNQYWTTLEEHFFLLQEVSFFLEFTVQGIHHWEAKTNHYHSDLLGNLAQEKGTHFRLTKIALNDVQKEMNQFAIDNPTFQAHTGEVANFFNDIIIRQQAERRQIALLLNGSMPNVVRFVGIYIGSQFYAWVVE